MSRASSARGSRLFPGGMFPGGTSCKWENDRSAGSIKATKAVWNAHLFIAKEDTVTTIFQIGSPRETIRPLDREMCRRALPFEKCVRVVSRRSKASYDERALFSRERRSPAFFCSPWVMFRTNAVAARRELEVWRASICATRARSCDLRSVYFFLLSFFGGVVQAPSRGRSARGPPGRA